ncbi:MAG TPA: hypothetical protein VE913_20405 [Longimicrobium sp.]|nr:hypothetical protein [Longimicrobium sp.]
MLTPPTLSASHPRSCHDYISNSDRSEGANPLPGKSSVAQECSSSTSCLDLRRNVLEQLGLPLEHSPVTPSLAADGGGYISAAHLAEAIQYRSLDGRKG